MSTLNRTRSFLPVTQTLLTVVGPWLILVAALYLIGIYNFLLFHSLAELFSIVVATTVFILAWNTRRFMNNHFLFFMGVSYLFAALIDLLHTLAYKGMGVFPTDANLPTQLWIAARYLQSLSFLSAVLLIRRKINQHLLFAVFSAITLLLLAGIASGRFPDCYVNGLTPFKKISEYIISLILAVSILLLRKERTSFSPKIHQLIILSLTLTILSELAFTFYIDVYGLSNFWGHIFKIIAVYCVYKAIIETGLNQPFDLLFHDMKQRELELEHSQKMMHEIATHDPLTGLPNRLLFDARLTHALEECRRNNYEGLKSMVQVIIMDMDNFKNVNDLLGHLAGDEVLKEIGRRLKVQIRASDTIARWGGDEFTCVLENVASIEDAMHTAEKILTSISDPMLVQGHEVKVKVSLGFSLYPIHGEDSETLLRNADAALYRAKETKDTHQMYDEGMNIFNSTFQRPTTANQ
jgi:diguanylate cyclase (GGDEF)-like protein